MTRKASPEKLNPSPPDGLAAVDNPVQVQNVPDSADAADSVDAADLLSAYADHGLNARERELVRAHLAENPAARQELGEIRALLAEVRERGEAPDTAHEPDWQAMAADIQSALGEQRTRTVAGQASSEVISLSEHARPRTRPRPRIRPRMLVAAGLAVAAAAAVVLALLARDSAPTAPGLAERDVPGERAPIDDENQPAMVDAEVLAEMEAAMDEAFLDGIESDYQALEDELDAADPEVRERALEAAFAAVEPDQPDPDDPVIGVPGGPRDGHSDPEMEDILAEWTGAAEEPPYSTGFGGELFPEPDYDAWLDELSDDDLRQLDRLLDEMQAG